MDDKKSGKRYEIVVLKVNRNNSGAVKELYALKDYFAKKGNAYSLLYDGYGSPAKALKKMITWYLDSEVLAHPKKTLYEINKMFIEKKVATSRDVTDMGVQADIEKLNSIVTKFFGGKPKENEDDE